MSKPRLRFTLSGVGLPASATPPSDGPSGAVRKVPGFRPWPGTAWEHPPSKGSATCWASHEASAAYPATAIPLPRSSQLAAGDDQVSIATDYLRGRACRYLPYRVPSYRTNPYPNDSRKVLIARCLLVMGDRSKELLRDEEGATAVEYGLIVAALAGLIVVVVFTLGKKINNTFNNVQSRL